MFERKPEEEIEKIREELKNESRDATYPILLGLCAGSIASVMVYIFGTKTVKPFEAGLVKNRYFFFYCYC